jgi:polar amino acid transport system ATP-binding protein
MLVAEGVQKSFGRTEVLHGVSIAVQPGRITVLIGPSGSGKTTLVKALSLLDVPSAGTIRVDDTTYRFPQPRRAAIAPPWPRLTVVFQQLFLWPHLTLRQNIILPVRNDQGYETQLEELVTLFGMRNFIDRYPNEVSLGERQRAAIARALMLNPAYILLDEITSALDVEQTSIILGHLTVLRSRGIGILIVTHLIEFARRLLERSEGDQIAFLDHGRILEQGGKEVLDAPQHERLRRFLSVIESAR